MIGNMLAAKSHENWGRSHEDIIWILSSVPSFKQYQDY